MNRIRVYAIAVAVALVFAAGAPALAESPSIAVGFNFVVNGKVFNAGTYTVAAANGNVVLTPSAGGAAVELTPLKPLKRGKIDRAELVFDQVGSMWFLSEAWLPEGGGFQIFKPETSLDRKSVKAPKA